MLNYDDITKENITSNKNWQEIPDYPYRILIIAHCGSGKRNTFLNIMNDISQCKYTLIKLLYAKDPYKAKHQFLINMREDIGLTEYNFLKLLLNTQVIKIQSKQKAKYCSYLMILSLIHLVKNNLIQQ